MFEIKLLKLELMRRNSILSSDFFLKKENWIKAAFRVPNLSRFD